MMHQQNHTPKLHIPIDKPSEQPAVIKPRVDNPSDFRFDEVHHLNYTLVDLLEEGPAVALVDLVQKTI
jgi:hypothetical protein